MSTESWEQIEALSPEEARTLDDQRRLKLIGAGGSAAARRNRRRAGAGGGSIRHHPSDPTAGRGARRRGRRRRAHHHRRLPLVHRLGPRHDDQPRRPDAGDRAPRGGARHPADVRAPHPRRADPQPVSRRRERGPVPHRGRDAVVLPRAGSLRAARPATSRRAGCCSRSWSTSSPSTSPARASASAWTRPTACCARAPPGYQLTWMDAKVGDWVVTPRRGQAGRDQRPLVQRAAVARGLVAGRRGTGTPPARDESTRTRSRGAPTRVYARSTSASGTPTAGTSSTSSTREAGGNDASFRPNQILALSLPHPVLDRGPLAAGVAAGRATGWRRRSACARSLPDIPTTSRATTATFTRGTPPIIRARCGGGWSARSSTRGCASFPPIRRARAC